MFCAVSDPEMAYKPQLVIGITRVFDEAQMAFCGQSI
jgi:hypothetical protein